MIDQDIHHHIQKYILSVLYKRKNARFCNLRKPGIDTNLFAYHLKLLLKSNFIKKIEGMYTLDEKGLYYVDRISETDMRVRMQPKIITMLVIQNSDGDTLLQKRSKQPYIDLWTLPYGKMHDEDESIKMAAMREACEKVKLSNANPKHIGDCYIRVISKDKIITSTLVHVFKLESDDIVQTENQILVQPREISRYKLAPAVEKIIARTFFGDEYFFEEFTEDIDNVS